MPPPNNSTLPASVKCRCMPSSSPLSTFYGTFPAFDVLVGFALDERVAAELTGQENKQAVEQTPRFQIKYQLRERRINLVFHGGRARIAVRDQGIGMDQKEMRQIFQKFYRTRRAEQSGEKGTGIGLSIVEQIVVHHGGAIEVASRPGEGSCFTLVMPPGAPAAVVGAAGAVGALEAEAAAEAGLAGPAATRA